MLRWRRIILPLVLTAVLVTAVATPAHADEADNFTCRGRLTVDSLAALDGWVNARIQEAVERANRAGPGRCDADCLVRALEDTVGKSQRKVTLVPGSRFVEWVAREPGIERCHLEFKDTIYGAKPYNHAWQFLFQHRIIYVADSIKLAGRTVGIDKIDHFIREGLDHWRLIHREGLDIQASIAHEVGDPAKRRQWTEYGVKGMGLTGVFAYADLAAGYFGYRFWEDALTISRPASFVGLDAATGRYVQRRTFTFADYVNDAWDESINCSKFDAKLGPEVASALARRAIVCGTTDPAVRARLAALPDAALYVNPENLAGTNEFTLGVMGSHGGNGQPSQRPGVVSRDAVTLRVSRQVGRNAANCGARLSRQ